MRRGCVVALVGLSTLAACGDAVAQDVRSREAARAALNAQVWGERPAVTAPAPQPGEVRLAYRSPSAQAGLAYAPGEPAIAPFAPQLDRSEARRRGAKLSYAASERVELFVDLQARKTSKGERPEDWRPGAPRGQRTYAVGISARW